MTIMDSMTDQGMNSLVSPHAFFRTWFPKSIEPRAHRKSCKRLRKVC
jgi:hypothetical protein